MQKRNIEKKKNVKNINYVLVCKHGYIMGVWYHLFHIYNFSFIDSRNRNKKIYPKVKSLTYYVKTKPILLCAHFNELNSKFLSCIRITSNHKEYPTLEYYVKKKTNEDMFFCG